MTATDSAGNPGLVAPDELIESAWGNAVAITVVKRYASVGDFNANNPTKYDGMVVAIGTTVCVWRAGALRGLASIVPAAVPVSGNVGGGSTVAVSAPVVFGPYPVPYVVRTTLDMVAFGASASGTVKPSVRNADGSTVLADGLTHTLITGTSLRVGQVADLLVNAGNTLTFSVWMSGTGTAFSVAGSVAILAVPA